MLPLLLLIFTLHTLAHAFPQQDLPEFFTLLHTLTGDDAHLQRRSVDTDLCDASNLPFTFISLGQQPDTTGPLHIISFHSGPRNEAAEKARLAFIALIEKLGGIVPHSFPHLPEIFTMRFPAGVDIPLCYLKHIPGIKYISEDGTSQSAVDPASTLQPVYLKDNQAFPESMDLWGLDYIDGRGNDVYAYDYTGADIHVYVIDSGIDYTHKDLEDRAELIWSDADLNLTQNNDEPFNDRDCTGHGTHVSGIVAGKITGVAKRAKIHALRVNGCDRKIKDSSVTGAFNKLREPGVLQMPAIINLSMSPNLTEAGGFPPSPILDNIIDSFSKEFGIPIVLSAGNDKVPICTPLSVGVQDIITVGSVSKGGFRSEFSNYGSCVSIFGPGTEIWSLDPGKSYRRFNGTSQAAPFITGVIALEMQRVGRQLTPAEAKAFIINTSVKSVKGAPLADGDKIPKPFVQTPLTLATGLRNRKTVSKADEPISTKIIIITACTVGGALLLVMISTFWLCRSVTKSRRDAKLARPSSSAVAPYNSSMSQNSNDATKVEAANHKVAALARSLMVEKQAQKYQYVFHPDSHDYNQSYYQSYDRSNQQSYYDHDYNHDRNYNTNNSPSYPPSSNLTPLPVASSRQLPHSPRRYHERHTEHRSYGSDRNDGQAGRRNNNGRYGSPDGNQGQAWY